MRSAWAIAAFGLLVSGCAGGSDSAGDTSDGSLPAPTETDSSEVASSGPTTAADESAGSASTASAPSATDRPEPADTVPATEPPTTDAPATTEAEPPPPTTVPADPPPPNAQLEGLSLGVELVAEIDYPTAVAWRADDPGMYVASEDGFVNRVEGDQIDLVADLSELTVPFEPGSERGLLGLAFSPIDDRMYLNYTDLDHDTHVVSYELVDGVADLESRREILFLDQPGLGHNGGRLLFDDDGNLFISSGDGGGSNGRDAQDKSKIFGALLRVRPNPDSDGYEIPEDNPFADGVDDRPEVWARGFRNPWTFSLDDETGDIWVGDVGNESREEIDLIPGGTNGQNFGWYWWEGTEQRHSDAPEGLTPPVFDYPRNDGVAVMGGHVYRGDEIPDLRGAYLFGDLTGPIWAIGADGVVRMNAEPVTVLVGWGEDPSGELYLLGLQDGVYKLVQR